MTAGKVNPVNSNNLIREMLQQVGGVGLNEVGHGAMAQKLEEMDPATLKALGFEANGIAHTGATGMKLRALDAQASESVQTSPPGKALNQRSEQGGYYQYTPKDSDEIKFRGKKARKEARKGKKGKKDTWGDLKDYTKDMKEKDPAAFEQYKKEHPSLIFNGEGSLVSINTGDNAAPAQAPATVTGKQNGNASAPNAERGTQSVMGRISPVGAGFAGLFVGGAGAGIVSAVAAAKFNRVSSTVNSAGGGGNGLDALSAGGFGSGRGWGMAAMFAGGMGAGGLSFQFRKQMKNNMREIGDNAMISMINNPGIPIEDLIFMFMTHMSQKYEDRLREKMEQAAIAEKMERRHEQLQDRSRMIGGIASVAGMVNPAAGVVAQGVAGAVSQGVQVQMALEQATSGAGGKSSTQLASEVQMLMHKWKQLTELMSNLIKSMHDMAMTPIRNSKV